MCVLIEMAVDTWGAPALARWRVAVRARWVGAGVLALAVAYLVDAASGTACSGIRPSACRRRATRPPPSSTRSRATAAT